MTAEISKFKKDNRKNAMDIECSNSWKFPSMRQQQQWKMEHRLTTVFRKIIEIDPAIKIWLS